MAVIDEVSQKPIVCPCGEKHNLSIVVFTYISKVVCNECGQTIA